jgi:AcrR family transcriptional regulator
VPPRDETEYEQRRHQIIAGALRVFANKGFDKATNKDIAEAAGIGSPGLIYHYFANKNDLLRQVVETHAPLMALTGRVDALMDMPPREALALFGNTLLHVTRHKELTRFFKLVLGEATRRPEVLRIIDAVGPGRWLPVLSTYLERQMDAGVLRRTDPALAARCFVGSLVVYVLTREVFGHADVQDVSPDAMVEVAIDIFLAGMQPEAGPAPDQIT